jgi:spore maturation protein CgeB
MRKKTKLMVGQIASPLPPMLYFKNYDLIISSLPHFVKRLKKKGVPAEYQKLCFDPRILNKIPKQKRVYDVTFVGGISRAHKQGFNLLNNLANRIKIDVWGYGKEELDKKSNLYKYHHGEAWGKDMYKLMLKSKITVNRHIDIAENYANNMRLYEATGCGAMLLTESKKNLGDIFQVGKEVVSYGNLDELISKIQYYSKNHVQRQKIAKAGQARTLKDHTYEVRTRELVDILTKYIKI